MASTIKIKRSGVSGRQPNTATLSVGELAINYKDQKLYSSNGTAVFQIGASGGGAVSITTATVKNLTQNDTVVTNVSSYANSVVDNSLLATKASWTALISTNTAIRSIVNDRLQVANAVATYLTKNNPVVTGTLTANGSTGTSGYYLRTSGTGVYWSPVATSGATWAALTGTNTALRTLISDRLQVANASTLYATKSNPTTSGLLAHTGRATISTNLSVSGNTILSGTLVANSSAGVAGYYLRTSGTGVYWSPVSASGGGANGFSGILVGANVVSADSTTDRLTLVAGSGISLAANPTTDTITIATSVAATANVVTKTLNALLGTDTVVTSVNGVVVAGSATGGGTDKVFYENDITITTSYTIGTNKNAMTAGPITINNGVTVTVPSGSVWSII